MIPTLRSLQKVWLVIISAATIILAFYTSCKKELSCEGCTAKNKPPLSVAGLDQVITLPTDSVLLDGSKSSDPDGKISTWQWTKVAGPASFTITKPSDSITQAKTLVTGIYQFELKVTDNGGLSAKDTVQIKITDFSQGNHPPVANAGTDQTITLPTNAVILNGSGSSDLDNNISSYLWTKILGPSSFTIANVNPAQTQVTNLVEGIYQFALKVTDAGGLFSTDTVQITVLGIVPPTNCDIANRPLVNARLMPVGTISSPDYYFAVATAGNKIAFAGQFSGQVYVYDLATNTCFANALSSQCRQGMVAVAVGNKILFAGGGCNDDVGVIDKKVDIYDVSANTWSTAELSQGRQNLAAATAGSKVVFAGGSHWGNRSGGNMMFPNSSSVVDIYDGVTNTWATATLTKERICPTATTVGNEIYFAGGMSRYQSAPSVADISYPSSVDIYDAVTNTWSTTQMQMPRCTHAAIAVDDKIYWAGGYSANNSLTGDVEIKDVSTGLTTHGCIFPKADFFAVKKNDHIIFFPGTVGDISHFDIYNTTTNTWSTGLLPQSVSGAAVISVNNTVYIAGGYVNGALSDKVWNLEF